MTSDDPRLEEIPQEWRLDGRGQLGDVVDGRQPADLDGIQADVAQAHARERLAARIELALLIVDQQEREAPVRMMCRKRIRQDTRERKIVPRNDGAG